MFCPKVPPEVRKKNHKNRVNYGKGKAVSQQNNKEYRQISNSGLCLLALMASGLDTAAAGYSGDGNDAVPAPAKASTPAKLGGEKSSGAEISKSDDASISMDAVSVTDEYDTRRDDIVEKETKRYYVPAPPWLSPGSIGPVSCSTGKSLSL